MGDIKSVARGFGNGDAVVQRKTGRQRTKTHDDPPGAVAGYLTGLVAAGPVGSGVDEGALEGVGDNQGHEGACELASALHGKDSRHHGTTPTRRCESV